MHNRCSWGMKLFLYPDGMKCYEAYGNEADHQKIGHGRSGAKRAYDMLQCV